MAALRIRLVAKPRSRPGGAGPTLLPPGSPFGPPDAEHAQEAAAACQALGMEGKVTPRNRVEVLAEHADIERMFRVSFATREVPREHPALSSGKHEFVVPDRVLEVPPELAETIAFAYVPTPPTYYLETANPPQVAFHHLTLGEVADELRATGCHNNGLTGGGIRVAMIDTGFASHPFFDTRNYTIVRVNGPGGTNASIDFDGHGTAGCANVFALAPDVSLIGVKLEDEDSAASALELAIAQNPHVVTNSWGWPIDNQSKGELQREDPNRFQEVTDVENIVLDAIADGVVMIFAAGNGHRSFPAAMPAVIAVGGATINANGSIKASNYASSFASALYPGRHVPDFCGIVGEFSQAEPMLGHIALPVPNGCVREGRNLPEGERDRGWGIFSGTSAAAPQVAGAVALMLSAVAGRRQVLSPADIRTALAASCRDVTEGESRNGEPAGPSVDAATGAGLVDAFAACSSL